MATVTVDIKQLLESGAHFGHKTSRWHPKMAPFIHSKRGGSHIIDLTKTVAALDHALGFIEETVASGKQILIIGTKRQTREVARQLAHDTTMPYVVERWLGGLLTNQKTVAARVKHLKDLEARMESGELGQRYSKLEVQRYQEEIDAMNIKFGGIKDMTARPGAAIVFDMVHDANAVSEAARLNIPVIAICDTNADPSKVTIPIPANDDAIKSLQLMSDYFRQAIDAGKNKRLAKNDKTENSEKTEKTVKTPTEAQATLAKPKATEKDTKTAKPAPSPKKA